MVANTGKFILMCFGNLIWLGLGNLVIGSPLFVGHQEIRQS
jgi:tRNA(Arg) A34 adenosine deaminase TadA